MWAFPWHKRSQIEFCGDSRSKISVSAFRVDVYRILDHCGAGNTVLLIPTHTHTRSHAKLGFPSARHNHLPGFVRNFFASAVFVVHCCWLGRPRVPIGSILDQFGGMSPWCANGGDKLHYLWWWLSRCCRTLKSFKLVYTIHCIYTSRGFSVEAAVCCVPIGNSLF